MFGRSNKGPGGYIIISSPDAETIERETMQCVHCGKHWVYKPGSGTERGWCMKCDGVTCGAQECNACVPLEARIEIMEGAKTPESRRYLEDYQNMQRLVKGGGHGI